MSARAEGERRGAGAAVRSGAPIRPSLSPLIWIAAATWAGSRVGTELALLSWLTSERAPLLAGALGAIAVVAASARLRNATLRWVACVSAAALVVALGHGIALATVAERLDAIPPQTWTAIACEDPFDGPFGTSVTVRLEGVAGQPRVRVSWPEGSVAPRYGERLTFDGRLRSAVRTDASGDLFRAGELLRSSPYRVKALGPGPGVLGALAGWRNASADRLRRIGGRGAEALASMLFAVRPTGDGAAALDDAKTAGVAWLITASGLHLGMIVLLAERMAAVAGAGRRGRTVAAIVAVCVVSVAAGLRLSLLRAAIAAASGVVGRLVGRRRDATATLGAAVCVLVLLDPAAPYDAGLSIAAVAVGAMALLSPLAKAWLSAIAGRRAAWALGASVVAQAAVAPLAASMFGAVALAGPLVLIVTGPLVQMAVGVGIVGAAVAGVWAGGGSVLLSAAAQAAGLAAAGWGWIARQPGASMVVTAVPWWVFAAWAAGGTALWLRWPTPRRAARVRLGVGAVLLVAVLFSCRAAPTGVIQVLDVGQGDAILVREGTHAVLVDTGPDPVVLRQALARAHVGALEGVVLTHAHEDHTGGLEGLAGSSRPGWIAVPDVEDEAVDALAVRAAAQTGRVLRLRAGMTFEVGRVRARVLWPSGGDVRLAANDTSVILLLEVDGRRALLLGDAEDQAQRGALRSFEDTVDVMKVAHHGSMNGNVPVALEKWRPRLALISVGTGNKFGHPTQGALAALAAVGAVVRRTDLEGDLGWDPGGPVGATATATVSSEAALPLLCDNRSRGLPAGGPPDSDGQVDLWLALTSQTSNRSTSSTAQRSCCWSAPRSAFASVSRPSPTSTSTWRRSTAPRPPPTISSTQPTRCRS